MSRIRFLLCINCGGLLGICTIPLHSHLYTHVVVGFLIPLALVNGYFAFWLGFQEAEQERRRLRTLQYRQEFYKPSSTSITEMK
jgi:hypothetical protein